MAREKRRGHGEGSIYQAKSDGRWVAALILPNGKRKYLYGKTRKEATDKLKSAQRAVDDGADLSAERLTVAQFLDKWLTASVKPATRHKTFTTYESLCRTAIVPRIGNRQLTKLTALDLQPLYTDLTESGLPPRTVHHVHRVLHRAFTQAVRWKLIVRNPCEGAQAPRVARAEMRSWTPEQADAFLISTREHRMHALYILALTTGMRQGELLGLRWSDIDWNAGTLAVRRALQWQRGIGLAFVEPKTTRSRRKIHLSQTALTALRAQMDRQAFDRHNAGSAWIENGLVFCDSVGEPLSPTNETKRFQRAGVAAGVPPIRFHDLRHTAATILLGRGVHVKLVSEMLGHSTIVLTLDTYSHVIPAMHGDAAAAMDSVFSA
jgi:integrase